MSESMRAMVVNEADGDFELVERDVPEAGPGEAVVRVEACGVCHSDSFAKTGGYPGVSFPVVPGHEIAGRVHALGDGVKGFSEGQRVGVGWYGGACGWCRPCRTGELISCQDTVIPGVTADGGYADYVKVRANALAAIPESLDAAAAAPLMCAGVTTFNALRHSAARGGDLVAVLGVGGLGHLGVQYARAMGFRVVAIARGEEKRDLALEMGAHEYIDSTASDPGEELQNRGGADVVLSTITNADAVAATIPGLGVRGRLVVVGAAEEPVPVPVPAMIGINAGLLAHASGVAADSEDAMRLAAQAGVTARIETLPLEQAAEAYQRMMDGDARFRMVLTM